MCTRIDYILYSNMFGQNVEKFYIHFPANIKNVILFLDNGITLYILAYYIIYSITSYIVNLQPYVINNIIILSQGSLKFMEHIGAYK